MPTPAHEPTPPPLTTPTLPVSTLEGLLEEVQGLLDNVVYYWDQLLFRRPIRQRLRNAWGELRSRVTEVAQRLRAGNLGESVEALLVGAGLRGAQWDFKLDAINDVWKRFHERGLSALLKSVLEWVGVVVDSLSKAFPQLEAVKEMIDGVKWLMSHNESLTGHEAILS